MPSAIYISREMISKAGIIGFAFLVLCKVGIKERISFDNAPQDVFVMAFATHGHCCCQWE